MKIKKLANGYTPHEQAHAIAITLLDQSIRERPAEFDEWSDDGFTNKERDEVKKQIAAIHDRLLKASGLDGIAWKDR